MLELQEAVIHGDYRLFRRHLEEQAVRLRKRVPRRVRVEDREEVVETALMRAFHEFEKRPKTLTFLEWLRGLINESRKGLIRK